MRKLLLLFALLASMSVDVSAQVGATTPVRSGTTLPATCAPGTTSGGVFYKTTAPTGTHECVVTNTWRRIAYPTNIVYVDGVTYPRTDVGINAAIVAAGTNGKVVVTPGAYTVSTSKIIVEAHNIEIEGYGAVLTCTLNDDCVWLGDASVPASPLYTGIRFKGFNVVAGAGSVGDSAIVNNGHTSTIEDIKLSSTSTYTFDYGVEILNDQAFKMDGLVLDSDVAVITATSSFVGSAIYNPAPSNENAAVGWITNTDLSMHCSGNGIDWAGANTLQLSDSVIQNFNQFAVRYNSTDGVFGTALILDNVYREVGGSCTNPFGNIGQADVIMQGGGLIDEGGLVSGRYPDYTVNATAGTTLYTYWVVIHNAAGNVTVPLAAGHTTTGNATISGTNSVNVVWPKITTAVTYDLLRISGTMVDSTAPYGTANYAVTTGYTQATCGTSVCTFTDTVPTASLTSFNASGIQTNFAHLDYWPGSRVLVTPSAAHESNNYFVARCISCTAAGADVSTMSPAGGLQNVHYLFGARNLIGQANLPYSLIASDSPSGEYIDGLSYFNATLRPHAPGYASPTANTKGIVNYGNLGQTLTNGDFLTLNDSNYAKTLSTVSRRPTSDAADTAIGYDNSGAGLVLRAGTSISSYINANPNNTSFLERLTASLKTFTVPITTNSQISSTLSTGTAPLVVASTTNVANLNASSLGGATFSAPGAIGGGTPSTIAGTSFNKVAITAPATSATLTIANGKTLTASNTLTFTGTDSSSVAFGAGGTATYTIASGTSAMGTGAITSATCASVVTTSATGTATTDTITADFNADPTGVTGYIPATSGMLTIIKYPTTNNVNFKVCNNTASSITPGAITLNWRVVR